MKHYFFLLLCISVSAFSQEKPLKYVDFFEINNVDFSVFNNPKYTKYYNKTFDKQQFLNEYFKVWNKKNQLISNTEYNDYFTYKATKKSPCIGENYSPLSNKIISEIKENIKIDKNSIGENLQLGITVKTANIRILPTDEFCFKKVRNAGESYPFDYFQNSTLWIGAPVSILATSNDQLWYFINSHNNEGWVKAEEIAFVDEKKAMMIQEMDFFTPIYDKTIVKGAFESTKVYLGSIFPAIIKNNTPTILIPKKGSKNQVDFEVVPVSNNNFKPFPIQFNANNVKNMMSELFHHKYTWGGINEGRDCSSTLKDFYTPFGLWLPRNSGQQKKVGEQIQLKGTNKQKLATVLNKGIPFLSTIYKRGHIVLYLGKSKTSKVPIIFHNVWGIKAYYKNKRLLKFANERERYGLFGIHNKKGTVQTRFNIGKVVITNIEPSKRLNTFKYLTTESFLENFNTLTLLK